MKVLFIEARKKLKLNEKVVELVSKLDGKIHLLYSIQYKSLAEDIKNKLKEKISGFTQILGCTKLKQSEKDKTKDETFLLIGSGRFHAVQVAKQIAKQSAKIKQSIYILEGESLTKISKEEIENIEKDERARLAKFHSSDTIGILVSTKPGQYNIKEAERVKEKLEKIGKKPHLFISNEINLNELENFKIDFWINTACPGIELDNKNMINSEKI